ncbi:MAG TPA: sulfatase [bacterium]|nr:sulfatase [bacterium]HPJ71522.1 sulfatase [bacterium]HPQ65173.1 sulfatase [bacterium]
MLRPKRNSIPIRLGLLALGGAFCLTSCGKTRSEPPPNVIFVILDAARADHFSGYGYGKPTTPRIDEIAARGATFLNNFAPATQTHDSLPLIMSSRYFSRPIFQMDTWSFGVRREQPDTVALDFDDRQVLLPDLMRENGYRTAMFHNHPWFVDETELGRAFHETFPFPTATERPVDEDMAKAVLTWIGGHRDKPFFIYYHVMSPHQPYPPKEEDALFIGPGETGALADAREKFENITGGESAGWTESDLRYFRALYDGNLAHSDRWIGRLYRGLHDLGLAENTLFIITSDHGELLGEHGWLTHGDFPPWEGLIHTPLIMVYPPAIPAGVRAEGLCEAVDIVPTICDLAGIDVPPGKYLAGTSLKPLLTDPGAGKQAVYIKGSVRTPNYHYLFSPEGFFDLRKDPGEIVDLTALQLPALKLKLRGDYEGFMAVERERYESAIRRTPPDFPFYFPICFFTVTSAAEASREGNGDADRTWTLNTSDREGHLVLAPRSGPSCTRLRLSCPLISGEYRVAVLVGPLEPGFSLDKDHFQGRVGGSDGFRPPREVTVVPGEDGKPWAYYLDYGPVRVKGGEFAIDLDFNPGPDHHVMVYHVKFSPPRADKTEPPGKEVAAERMKKLRALGYVH